jgi:hypothetical protein
LPCKNNNDEIFKSRYRDVRNKLKNVISINELFRPKIKKGVEDYTQNTSWYGMVWYGMVWYGMVKLYLNTLASINVSCFS